MADATIIPYRDFILTKGPNGLKVRADGVHGPVTVFMSAITVKILARALALEREEVVKWEAP